METELLLQEDVSTREICMPFKGKEHQVMNANYDIIHDRDHYVVYCDGKFFCSADTFHEAVKEIEKERR